DHEFPQRVGETAGYRADHEDADRGAENGACAEFIGHPTAQGDEDREAQEIASDGEVEPQRILVERAGDGRQGGGYDRRIERLHEERAGDDQRNDVLCGNGHRAIGKSVLECRGARRRRMEAAATALYYAGKAVSAATGIAAMEAIGS